MSKELQEVQYANDGDIISACEDGRLDWEMTEHVELGNENPSDEALRLRGIIGLMLNESLTFVVAQERYKELLAVMEKESKRTIPTLLERAEKLCEEGKLKSYELDDFIAGDDVAESKVEALLGGADRKEADRFARLTKQNSDKWDNSNTSDPTDEECNKVRAMSLRYKGMDDAEIGALLVAESAKSVPVWLKSRIIGMSREMAMRFQDLVDRAEELGHEEHRERKAYINLRHVLTTASCDLETYWAMQDFGVERMFDYILLNMAADLTYDRVEAVLRSVPITKYNRASVQRFIDNIEAQHKPLEEEKEARREELAQALENEPVLSKFVWNYRDPLMQAVDGGFFG